MLTRKALTRGSEVLGGVHSNLSTPGPFISYPALQLGQAYGWLFQTPFPSGLPCPRPFDTHLFLEEALLHGTIQTTSGATV